MLKEQITEEIMQVIQDEKNKDVILQKNWIAKSVMDKYFEELPKTDEVEMVRYLSMLQCRRMVRQVISKQLDGNGSDNRQFILPGFNHLQTHYAVRREGESVGVPISLMTRNEILAKSKQYRVMGEACFAHAVELDRYAEELEAEAV